MRFYIVGEWTCYGDAIAAVAQLSIAVAAKPTTAVAIQPTIAAAAQSSNSTVEK